MPLGLGGCPESLVALAAQCLSASPDERPTALDVKEWLEALDSELAGRVDLGQYRGWPQDPPLVAGRPGDQSDGRLDQSAQGSGGGGPMRRWSQAASWVPRRPPNAFERSVTLLRRRARAFKAERQQTARALPQGHQPLCGQELLLSSEAKAEAKEEEGGAEGRHGTSDAGDAGDAVRTREASEGGGRAALEGSAPGVGAPGVGASGVGVGEATQAQLHGPCVPLIFLSRLAPGCTVS